MFTIKLLQHPIAFSKIYSQGGIDFIYRTDTQHVRKKTCDIYVFNNNNHLNQHNLIMIKQKQNLNGKHFVVLKA